MYPILVDWGPFFIPSWHFFYVLAAFASYFVLTLFVRQFYPRISKNFLISLFTVGYISGYFGARLLSIIIEEFQYETILQKLGALFVLGPMTLYGGMIATCGACLAYVLYKREDPRPLLDCAIPAGVFGVAVGRIGCFLNGDDYGIIVGTERSAAPWWAVNFPNHEIILPRLPIQLIEAGVCLAIVALVFYWMKKFVKDFPQGFWGIVTICLYAFSRFFLEYGRGDPRGWIVTEKISTSQGISIVILAFCSISILALWRHSK